MRQRTLLEKIEALSPLAVMALCAGGIAVTAFMVLRDPFPKLFSGPQDFAGFYMGARNVGTASLYDPVATMKQEAIVTGAETLPMVFQYVRLPFYAVLLRPLTLLPYPDALLVWKALSLAGLLAAALLADSSWKVGALAISWSVAAMVMLQWGQDTWVPLLLLCVFFRLLAGGKIVTAGFCVGAAMALKPHIFLPFAAAVIVADRRRLFAAAMAPLAAAVAISFLVQGADWPVSWMGNLRLDAFTANPGIMPTIEGIFGQRLGTGLPLYGAVTAAMVLLAGVAARRLPFDIAAAIAVLLGLLGSAHSYPYDLLLVVPASLLIARRTGSGIPLGILTPVAQIHGIPIISPLAAATAGLLAALMPMRSAGNSGQGEEFVNQNESGRSG